MRPDSITNQPARLIANLEHFFAERAYLPQHAALILALFVLNTWTFEACDTTPYLSLESPVPQCGKTTVLSLLEAVVCTPRQATATSEAALFRVIEAFKPTLLIDEAEMLLGRGDRAEAIRAIANIGYKRGATVPRCIGEGTAIHVRDFHVFCPKVFAGIGGLRGALLDRCIVISMHKRPPEVRLKSAKYAPIRRAAIALRERLATYQAQARHSLAGLYADMPDEGYWPQLLDREGEIFEPLLLHARGAGPEMEARALEAALALSHRKQEIQADDQEFTLALELFDALEQQQQVTFAPADLVGLLSESEFWGARLSEKDDPKAKAAQIGMFIRRFRLRSRQRTRQGTRYETKDAMENLAAFASDKSATPATPATPATDADGSIAYGVTDRREALQPPQARPGAFGNGVADAGSPVAGGDPAPATHQVNGGAVAGVASVAGVANRKPAGFLPHDLVREL
ncbi:MAG TPA: DUF3631 domain-containing protein [Terriglobales bacterium]|nr:DUF3631 domain-containing protein [Terriglobales bacterium]